MTTEQEARAPDVIQIVNEKHHWYPCLAILSEPKPFGCQAYVLIPTNDREKPTSQAYIRLKKEDYVIVGEAEIFQPGDGSPS